MPTWQITNAARWVDHHFRYCVGSSAITLHVIPQLRSEAFWNLIALQIMQWQPHRPQVWPHGCANPVLVPIFKRALCWGGGGGILTYLYMPVWLMPMQDSEVPLPRETWSGELGLPCHMLYMPEKEGVLLLQYIVWRQPAGHGASFASCVLERKLGACIPAWMLPAIKTRFGRRAEACSIFAKDSMQQRLAKPLQRLVGVITPDDHTCKSVPFANSALRKWLTMSDISVLLISPVCKRKAHILLHLSVASY